MKRRMTVVTAALIALMTSTAVTAVWAETAAEPTASAAKVAYETQERMLQTADEALTAVTRVHAARLAIFDNRIEDAKTLITEARTALASAEGDLMIADPEQAGADKTLLPFDMSMALTEDFTPTEESRKALEKAAGLMQTQKQDEAVEVLRLADVQINVQAALLPADRSMRLIDDAGAALDKGEFHTANLALKEIEDSILVRAFSINAVPEQAASN